MELRSKRCQKDCAEILASAAPLGRHGQLYQKWDQLGGAKRNPGPAIPEVATVASDAK